MCRIDISIINEYFVRIDFPARYLDSLPSNSIKFVFPHLSRCNAAITITLLLLLLLVCWGQGGIAGPWDGFSET